MKIAVVMGSKSDLPKLESGIALIKEFGVEVAVRVLSAHRTPVELTKFLEDIKDDTDVIIAAAGKSSTMDGLDSLLSMVQMPGGIPVATVTIDSGLNAALMALEIIGIKYPKIAEKLVDYRQKMADKVLADDASLEI